MSAHTSPQADDRAEPVDLSHHLSRTTRARQASSVKAFYKYFAIPGIGQLAGGLPNSSYFPFDTLEAQVAHPDRWKPCSSHDQAHASQDPPDPTSKPPPRPQSHLVVPHTSPETNPLRKIDLDSALQYGTAQGYPPLYGFVRDFTRNHLHVNCPYRDGPEVLLTCGNTDGFAKTLMALTDEWSAEKDCVHDRDALLVEKFCYMNAIQTARPRGLNIVPVEVDDEGMLAEGPGGLRQVLENWDFTKGRMPRLMYTVTMGQNPTSGVLSLHRRRQLYALCCRHDIIIIEDDPYWYLQYPSGGPHRPSHFLNHEPHPPGWKSSGSAFLDSLVPSSLSIDSQGRVIRLDTFSKTIAPGCRLGWLTAQPRLIERLLRITETSTQQPSGFVQATVAQLLLGPGAPLPAWTRWLSGLRGAYQRRAHQLCTILAAGAILAAPAPAAAPTSTLLHPTRLYSFARPAGGMFVWLRVGFASHPLHAHYAARGQAARLARALWVWWTTAPFRVLVAPGGIFAASGAVAPAAWPFYRVCFAAVGEAELRGVAGALVEGVRAFWEVRDARVVEGLLGDDDDGGDDDDDDATSWRVKGSLEGVRGLAGPC